MRLLWVGDAACDSGFARATHYTLEGFIKAGWEIRVLGLNYRGDAHDYPYKMYPAFVAGGNMLGTTRVRECVEKFKPDVVVFQNDPWNIPHYMRQLQELRHRPVFVGAIAIDGLNCRGTTLQGLDHCIFWTQFAADEARIGGWKGTSSVIPLGVDLDIYYPGDQLAARKLLVPDQPQTHAGFWVLNVNRNQPRKRLDLTIEYFAEWMNTRKVEDAYLYFHVCPTGDVGIDCNQLAAYYGLRGHMMLSEPDPYKGFTEEGMRVTYQAASAVMSTTIGEGWGLTTMEAMACGIPTAVPDWSALGEWAKDAALLVPCTSRISMWGGPNVIGGIADKSAMIDALDSLYTDHAVWEAHRRKGINLANQPQYRWQNIASRFAEDVADAYRRVNERSGQDDGQAALRR